MSKGNVGNRIRVVDADACSNYVNGDEGVIVQVDEECSGADIRFDKNEDSNYLYGDEYELIHETSSATEEAIPWAVGQEVFCLLRGKGVVVSVGANQEFWDCGVTVLFVEHGNVRYRLDGKVSQYMSRCLFFSEPQIIAETMPPKKPFVPVLKKGDIVFAYSRGTNLIQSVEVSTEDEDCVRSDFSTWYKNQWTFFKIGEEVEFNV